MNTGDYARVRRKVWAYYKKHGRHDLPWRETSDPYSILVSEVMLQQTQVVRVLPKYRAFLKQFPTCAALSQAPLKSVLKAWQGLGYNRRGKALHDTAKVVMKDHDGALPQDQKALEALPGLGPYTAGAVLAFAYNKPVVILETNIRTVLFHELLHGKAGVPDSELMLHAEKLLTTKKPREWYWALMDYGAHLKDQGVKTNSRSKHYTKQSTFKGSDREVRGAILRVLTERAATEKTLIEKTNTAPKRVGAVVRKMASEGLIHERAGRWRV